MDYMASPEEREELIRIGKENDRKNGLAGDTPEEKPANSMTGRTDHTADVNHCYYELLDIEDCALRKTAFKQLESKCSDVYSFDGTDELEVFSNFLALRLKGPLTIDHRGQSVQGTRGILVHRSLWRRLAEYRHL